MTAKTSRGRPSKSPRSQISLTLSPELKEYLERQASRQGLNVSEYVRLKVSGSSGARPERIDPVDLILGEPFPEDWDDYHQRVSHETYEFADKISRWSDYLTARDLGYSVDEYRDKSKNQIPYYLQGFNQEERFRFWDLMREKGLSAEEAILEMKDTKD